MNSVPQNLCHSKTQSVTLFGNRVFTDIISYKMRLYWIRMGPNPMAGILIRNAETHMEKRPYDDRGKD